VSQVTIKSWPLGYSLIAERSEAEFKRENRHRRALASILLRKGRPTLAEVIAALNEPLPDLNDPPRDYIRYNWTKEQHGEFQSRYPDPPDPEAVNRLHRLITTDEQRATAVVQARRQLANEIRAVMEVAALYLAKPQATSGSKRPIQERLRIAVEAMRAEKRRRSQPKRRRRRRGSVRAAIAEREGLTERTIRNYVREFKDLIEVDED
jgi:hypothetical protein